MKFVRKHVNILASRSSIVFSIIIVKDTQPALPKLAGQFMGSVKCWKRSLAHSLRSVGAESHVRRNMGTFLLLKYIPQDVGCPWLCKATFCPMTDATGTQGTQFIGPQVILQFYFLVTQTQQ